MAYYCYELGDRALSKEHLSHTHVRRSLVQRGSDKGGAWLLGSQVEEERAITLSCDVEQGV